MLVTTRKEAKSELERIREEYGAEYEIIGIAYPRESPEYGEEAEGVPVVCRAEDISCYIQTKWVDAVMISAGSEMLLPVWVIRGVYEHGCDCPLRSRRSDSDFRHSHHPAQTEDHQACFWISAEEQSGLS